MLRCYSKYYVSVIFTPGTMTKFNYKKADTNLEIEKSIRFFNNHKDWIEQSTFGFQ